MDLHSIAGGYFF